MTPDCHGDPWDGAPLLFTPNLVWFLFYMIFGAPSVAEYRTSSADSLTVVLTRLKSLEPAGAYAKSLARSLWMPPQCPLYLYPERKTHSVGLRSMFLLFTSISSHEAGIVSQSPVTCTRCLRYRVQLLVAWTGNRQCSV